MSVNFNNAKFRATPIILIVIGAQCRTSELADL